MELEGIERDAAALRIISPAYAGRDGELTAILQYVYQAVLLDANKKTEPAKAILAIAVEEMRHLEMLGALIVKLGAPPVFTACPPYPVSYYSASNVDYVRSFPKMLAADIRAERGAVVQYTGMLRALKNSRVRAVIEEIRADEERHLKRFEELAAAL